MLSGNKGLKKFSLLSILTSSVLLSFRILAVALIEVAEHVSRLKTMQYAI